MSVYIVTVPNMVQFATRGGSGKSIVESDTVCYIEGRREGYFRDFIVKSTSLSSNIYIKGSKLSFLSL